MKDLNPTDSLGITKAKIDSNIITGTLDTLNSGQFIKGGKSSKASKLDDAMKASTAFQKKILNAVYASKGSIIDSSK